MKAPRKVWDLLLLTVVFIMLLPVLHRLARIIVLVIFGIDYGD